MRKSLFILLLLAISLVTNAQKDVTKFLGIPIDGTKAEMIQKLKAKGFVTSEVGDLKGQFNGSNVYVSVVTNNNKVYRIMVEDQFYLSETDIKIRFNELCHQFEHNDKYLKPDESQALADDENINNGIYVKNKRFQAAYYQYDKTEYEKLSLALEELYDKLSVKYTQGQLQNPTREVEREIANEINTSRIGQSGFAEYLEENHDLSLVSLTPSDAHIFLKDFLFGKSIDYKLVWFMITRQSSDEYYINLYYDNVYNQANGEDL